MKKNSRTSTSSQASEDSRSQQNGQDSGRLPSVKKKSSVKKSSGSIKCGMETKAKRTNSHALDSDSRGTRRHKSEGIKEGSTPRSRHEQAASNAKSREQSNGEESFGLRSRENSAWQENWLEVATRFCGMDDGISDRIHRLKALGNAIVPQIAFQIIKMIAQIERGNNEL